MLIVPSVTTKGVMPVSVMMTPLNNPAAPPVASEPSIASGMLRPAFMSSAPATADSARADPIERSMPAVMMTSVSAIARMAVIDDWRKMLMRL